MKAAQILYGIAIGTSHCEPSMKKT